MKQTITILSALIAVVLLATGFIVASNLELTRKLENCENQLLLARGDLADAQSQIKRHTQERADLSRKLEQAEAASRQLNQTLETQKEENRRTLLALESLAAEYRDLSEAYAKPEKENQQAMAESASSPTAAAPSVSLPAHSNIRHRNQTFFICWQ